MTRQTLCHFMDHLLIIDDERFFARQYSRDLEQSFNVTICTSATKGMEAFLRDAEICALILDIQMPTPANVAEYETANGSDTGIWMLRTHRDEFASRSIPIIILTNRKEDEIKNRIVNLKFPTSQIKIFRKTHTHPSEFAKRVKTLVMRHRASVSHRDSSADTIETKGSN